MPSASTIIHPDLESVFLKALQYPLYARPEFYLKQQQDSGWSKVVFFNALHGISEYFDTKLAIQRSDQRRLFKKDGKILPSDFGINLEKETQGKLIGTLTGKSIQELRSAIDYAARIDLPKPKFNSYQILAFCERILTFVIDQFEIQLKKDGSARFVAERLRKLGHQIEGSPEYIIYHYQIISEAPLADFSIFKNELRKLILTSRNPAELRVILQPTFQRCKRIIELWNEDLINLDEPTKKEYKNKAVRDERVIEFDHHNLTIWHADSESANNYYRIRTEHFMNRDFAEFAYNVAEIISREVFKETEVAKNLPDRKFANFDDLFIIPETIIPAYRVLIEEEIITENFDHIGHLKTAFCVWINELKRAKLIHHCPDRLLNELLNKKISSLRLSLASYRKPFTRAENQFRNIFQKKLSKLSQLSQERKL